MLGRELRGGRPRHFGRTGLANGHNREGAAVAAAVSGRGEIQRRSWRGSQGDGVARRVALWEARGDEEEAAGEGGGGSDRSRRGRGAWPAARLGCSSDEGLEAAGKDGAGPFCWAARRRREPRCGGGGARRRARQRQPQEAEAGGGAGVEAGRREGHRGWPTRGLRGIRRNRSRGLATEEKDEGIGSKQQEGEMAALRGGRGDGTRARLGVRGDRAGLTGRLGQA